MVQHFPPAPVGFKNLRVDIFCSVVDNFGDIGVCWRLARQLAHEYSCAVRLWVDDLFSFKRLCPDLDPTCFMQRQGIIDVGRWDDPWPSGIEPAQWVIEAFGCALPAIYIQAMAQSERPVLWLNLEYLTAESWTRDCHQLPSLQPLGLRKFFFFPGFSTDLGGLLREGELCAKRRQFQANSHQRKQFFEQVGVCWQPDVLYVSLFSYKQPALRAWFDCMASGDRLIKLLVPWGKVVPYVAKALGRSTLSVGECVQRGNLWVYVLPFMTADAYDRLLWSCDLNFVRGEDSFVRAQWAARPLIWHIYPQEDGAHWAKLAAFFELYTGGASSSLQGALKNFWWAWNEQASVEHLWQDLLAALPALTDQAEHWATSQERHTDLAGKLVSFYSDWL